MKYNYREMARWLLKDMPKSAHKVYISIPSLNYSLRHVFADEMKYATAYIPTPAEGMILVNLCAFSKALVYILASVDQQYMKIISSEIDKKNFTLYISAEGGMLPRDDMAAISVAMMEAGFQLEYYDDMVSLTAPLRERRILTVYERDPELLRSFITYDFIDFQKYEK